MEAHCLDSIWKCVLRCKRILTQFIATFCFQTIQLWYATVPTQNKLSQEECYLLLIAYLVIERMHI